MGKAVKELTSKPKKNQIDIRGKAKNAQAESTGLKRTGSISNQNEAFAKTRPSKNERE